MKKSEVLALLFLLKMDNLTFENPEDCIDQFEEAVRRFDDLLATS